MAFSGKVVAVTGAASGLAGLQPWALVVSALRWCYVICRPRDCKTSPR